MKKQKGLPKTYVLGDLHGAYKSLIDVLRKSPFNPQNDNLVFIGDLADGYDDIEECVDKLMSFKHLYPVMGNHDIFLKTFLKTGEIMPLWIKNGGTRTIEIVNNNSRLQEKLLKYFELCQPYHYIDEKLFVHGGIDVGKSVEKQLATVYYTNRSLFKNACANPNHKIKVFIDDKETMPVTEIFIGHTPTKKNLPVTASNVTNVDTGSGSIGCLTLMDVYSKKYVQSTKSELLYKK